jgi:type IV pilus assembly protein PilX
MRSDRMNHLHSRSQRGIALVFVLIMMTIVTAMAVISARITLLGERSARNDRDRQVAFQSAEMALNDAELDIMDPNSDRGCQFGTPVMVGGEGCSTGATTRGVCGVKPALGDTPIYKDLNWEATGTSRAYVNFGEFTGRTSGLQTNTFAATAAAPKYIIVQTTLPVVVPFDSGKRQYETTNAYRVYALGYGASRDTQVMLEAVIAKPLLSSKCTVGGL